MSHLALSRRQPFGSLLIISALSLAGVISCGGTTESEQGNAGPTDAAPDNASDAAGDVTTDTGAQDGSVNDSSDARPDVTVDGGTPDAQSDVTVDGGTPDAQPDVTVDGETPDAQPDVTVDGGTPDAQPDVTVDGGTPDAQPDVASDGGVDGAPPPDASADGAVDGSGPDASYDGGVDGAPPPDASADGAVDGSGPDASYDGGVDGAPDVIQDGGLVDVTPDAPEGGASCPEGDGDYCGDKNGNHTDDLYSCVDGHYTLKRDCGEDGCHVLNGPVDVCYAHPTYISAGSQDYSCAAMSDETLRCWGRNQYGQLGTGTTQGSDVPVRVLHISNAVDVAAGHGTTFCRTSGGDAYSWGRNDQGQLGQGVSSNYSTTAMLVIKLPFSDEVPPSVDGHACSVGTDGTIQCWGYNNEGQLGDGTTISSNYPRTVLNLTDAVDAAVGGSHSCAVVSNGDVYCWGSNAYGQSGTTSTTSVPTKVPGIDNAVTVSAGYGHTCALLDTGKIACWGQNDYGQLGNGSYANTPIPTLVTIALPSGSSIVQVSAGYTHTCALVSDGTVWCWGRNNVGQLGNGTVTEKDATPQKVVGLTDAEQVSAGFTHTCAVLGDGSARCWGANNAGQLGDGQKYNWSTTPVHVKFD